MKNFRQNKRLAVKAVSVFVCVVMLLGIAPIGNVLDLVQNASAVEAVYNPAYGTYTVSGNELTAVPYENCGFCGWYYDGKIVPTKQVYIWNMLLFRLALLRLQMLTEERAVQPLVIMPLPKYIMKRMNGKR